MPAFAPPARDERELLEGFLAYQQSAFLAASFGLTDEQARSRSTVSSLSIGALIKHAAGVQDWWMQRVAAAPNEPPEDPRPMEQQIKDYDEQFVMGADETLAGILDAFAAQNARTLQLAKTADLDARVPVPKGADWFPSDVDAWSVRWVFLHLISELARHAGHADIIRESVDGATMRDLVASSDG